jgi:hypothetical protein
MPFAMSDEAKSTLPKPYVFVLMPLATDFDDIYRFGIKGAADDVGAYADRVDEQIFQEGILERIFNQIAKADVVVADMTGRNPNVFYEVGYAHALGKMVLLLTQNADDIPFDLKHRQHIVYAGKIDTLRKQLAAQLRWAINEVRKGLAVPRLEHFSVRVNGIPIDEGASQDEAPVIEGVVTSSSFHLPLHVRNDSFDTVGPINYVYLFARSSSSLVPCEYQTQYDTTSSALGTFQTTFPGRQVPRPLDAFVAASADASDNLASQYRLEATFPQLPPGAVDASGFDLMFRDQRKSADDLFRLRLHTTTRHYDFVFRLSIELKDDSKSEDEEDQREESIV